MHYAARMGISQGMTDTDQDAQQAAQRILLLGRFRVAAQLFEHLGKTAALHHLHAEEQAFLAIDPEFVNRHDIRMFQLAGDLRLLHEASLFACVPLVEEVLDGHFAADVAVHCSQHGTHAAAGDLALDDVALARFTATGQQLADRESAGMCGSVCSSVGTINGCLQVGQPDWRPANSSLTFSLRPQRGQEKVIMAGSGKAGGVKRSPLSQTSRVSQASSR
jgi:hypothetical protein